MHICTLQRPGTKIECFLWGLDYFKTQPVLSPWQVRWWEYLPCFNYNTIHINGERNWVADTLSHYYKYDAIEDIHPNKEFVKVDEILDPDGELLPVERFVEIWNNVIRKLCRLKDKPSDTMAESVALNNISNTSDSVSSLDDEDVVTITSGNDKESLHIHIEQSFYLTSSVKKV